MNHYPMPTEKSCFDIIILANGNFPTHPIPTGILYHHHNNILCCDGAANALLEKNIIPKAIIGDCDSISRENRQKYRHIITQIDEQNTNDLTKTILFCQKQSFQTVTILGATGKREDHTLANIGLLTRFIHIVPTISMITNYGIFNVINQPSSFESYTGQQVSLFPFSSTCISTKNLKYPLYEQSLDYWWQGTLNESQADYFNITVQDTCVIYRAFSQ